MLKFLYFKNLKYSKQSIRLIKKKFKLIEKNFPTQTIKKQDKDTVVLNDNPMVSKIIYKPIRVGRF